MFKRKIKFNDIETPTTIEGFRENLRKYYCVIEGKTKDEEHLYVQDKWNIMIKDLEALGFIPTSAPPSPLAPIDSIFNVVFKRRKPVPRY